MVYNTVMLKLFNSLTRKIEDFVPLNPPKVTMYTCGPTVYDYTHIGHLKKYVGDDILRRVLEANGYQVKEVMNITDVGHLTSDADEGEDKFEKGAKEKGMDVWQLAKFFEEYFWKSIEQVNIERPNIVANATAHINKQVKLIEILVKKGFTYQTNQAIYFDVSRFPNYGQLGGQKLAEKKVGVREEVVVDQEKKHPQDFALWFFTTGRFVNHVMRWPSPFGEGFPGWHIECSAMSMEYLGDTIDIHTGGVDHLTIHHPNEIAQSEAATGKPFVKYWVHHEFLLVEGEKMSKSKKNFYTIDDIKEKGLPAGRQGFDPLSLRYLFLTGHYRDTINFTWESLGAARTALNNLREEIRAWPSYAKATAGETVVNNELIEQANLIDRQTWQRFMEAANNDLNMPQALAVMWELIHNDMPSQVKAATVLEMDKIFGLNLADYLGKPLEIPTEVQKLVEKREQARSAKDFTQSDRFRDKIKKLGYEVEDTPVEPKVKLAS